MKESYEKDPFAEYDKYWGELEEQEDKVRKEQEKEYRFEDSESSNHHYEPNNEIRKRFATIFISFAVFLVFAFIINSDAVNTRFISTPIIIMVLFSVVVSILNKNKHK